VLISGDLTLADRCRAGIAETPGAFGRIDVLVSNAAYQLSRKSLEETSDAE
jgi:NAD(P)-dependent dehydrogenase (short-subunit alcohol dehydrogenase family)